MAKKYFTSCVNFVNGAEASMASRHQEALRKVINVLGTGFKLESHMIYYGNDRVHIVIIASIECGDDEDEILDERFVRGTQNGGWLPR